MQGQLDRAFAHAFCCGYAQREHTPMHTCALASSPSRCGTLSDCAVKKSPTSCGCWLPLPLYHAAVALPAGPLPGVTERPGPTPVALARCPAAGLLGAGLEEGLP